MKRSPAVIKRHLKELRKLVESHEDPVVKRIAYAMEHAIRWATEDTVGWGSMAQEAVDEAAILKKEQTR